MGIHLAGVFVFRFDQAADACNFPILSCCCGSFHVPFSFPQLLHQFIVTLAQQLDAVHDLIMGVDSQLVRHGKVIPPCGNNLPQGIPCAAFLTLKIVADLLL